MSNRLESKTAEIFLASIAEIAPFLKEDGVTEVMVNAGSDVWVERRGVMEKTSAIINPVSMRGAIMTLARLSNQDARENSKDAIINARFDDLRIAAVLAPTAVDGHAMCIRKHTRSDMRLSDYEKSGAFQRQRPNHAQDESEDVIFPGETLSDYFVRLIKARKNILVSGGTGTGKTTFVNALLAEIPENERVLTIEDTVELNVRVPNKIRLLSNASAGIPTRDLLRLALRMRPDRVIVGEVRGEEAFDLLQALNTGHDGGFATLHANDARLALTRLESMVMLGVPAGGNWPIDAIRMQIASCITHVVHIKRDGNRRFISEILAVEGYRSGDYICKRIF